MPYINRNYLYFLLSTILLSISFEFFVPNSFFVCASLSLLIFATYQVTRQEQLIITENSEQISKQNDEFADDVAIFAFLERSSLSSSIVDYDFNIIKPNESFRKTLKLPENTIINFSSLIDEESIEKLTKLVTTRLNNDICTPVELFLPKSEQTILAHVNTIVYQDKSHLVFTVIDTTSYKTLEKNLAHSQKMQAIGQLAGAIAHDFNNLLTAIIGFSDLLLLRHPPGDKSFSEIMQIKQNSNRAANLVKQLLAFARKQVLKPNVIDITSTIEEVSTLIRRLIGSNIDLDIRYGNKIYPVKVDQSQLEQVIINLAVNARDAMREGGQLIIDVSNFRIDENFSESRYYAPIGDEPISHGNYVLIKVKDSGTGINPAIRDKIFEPFFSTKDVLSGTGLGLSTVYGIIKQTGGYIRLMTKENEGTTFFIFLKAAQIEEQKEKHTMIGEIELEKPISQDDKRQGKILVVDDETAIRIFSVHALTRGGYEVIEAESAENALEIISNDGNNYSLIITDVIMPGLTGPQIAQHVQKKHPHIKFIFTSGYAEDAVAYLSNVNCHFLAKPYTLKDLSNKVKEVLSISYR